MGDSQNAAAALAGHPGWVAVHENTLGRVGVVLAMARSEWLSELDYESLVAVLDGARRESQRARGVDMDAPTETDQPEEGAS